MMLDKLKQHIQCQTFVFLRSAVDGVQMLVFAMVHCISKESVLATSVSFEM